jgi:hypothetical protein
LISAPLQAGDLAADIKADMDGLPLQETSGLEYASRRQQIDPESSVRTGVESTVVALMELLGRPRSD